MAHSVGGWGNEVWIGVEFYIHYTNNKEEAKTFENLRKKERKKSKTERMQERKMVERKKERKEERK